MMRSFLVTLGLLAASIAPAAAQYVPQGSYEQSCVDIHTDGNMLVARCTAPNGRYVRSRLAIDACGGGDISNRDGYLACNRNGGGNGDGYGNGYAPQGSYQDSCVNIRSNGNTLSAQCTAPNGRRQYSEFPLSSCRGGDIANRDGYLACNGQSGYNPGHVSWRLPPGSYQSSCRNLSASQGVLTGQCTASNGAWIASSLQWFRCAPGTDIANIDGRLECLAYR